MLALTCMAILIEIALVLSKDGNTSITTMIAQSREIDIILPCHNKYIMIEVFACLLVCFPINDLTLTRAIVHSLALTAMFMCLLTTDITLLALDWHVSMMIFDSLHFVA
jgi:hypothetical protein